MFLSTIPVLASLDIAQSAAFYESRLGFTCRHEEPEFGIVQRDDVEIHFWKCDDRSIAELTSCRILVDGIEDLYREWEGKDFIHPNARLAVKPWGLTEFGIVDLYGNLIVFFEKVVER